MHVAVVISTYKQPDWLEKVLWGYGAQTTDDFDILVADDGSGERTSRVIDRARGVFGSRLKHVWQEDRGFRKCEILNKAITATKADYLIFTDGDCIPREDFVQVHRELAEPDRFLSGGMIRLSRALSETLTREDIEDGRFADPRWLRRRGWAGGRRTLRLMRSKSFAALFDKLTPTGATFNGHNASVSRQALLEINGFDVEMGYGGLDRALGERLNNHGLRGKQVRHRAICLHLDHDRPYKSARVLQRNHDIRARIRAAGLVTARAGIGPSAQNPEMRESDRPDR